MQISVSTYVFTDDLLAEPKVTQAEFNSLLDYSLWLSSASEYFQNSVRFNQMQEAVIVTFMNDNRFDAIIRMRRGELLVEEFEYLGELNES